jgi:transposase
VRNRSVWVRLLGLARTVVEQVTLDEEAETIIVSVRPTKGARHRCGACGQRSPRYDRGEGRRRWRALDVGELRWFLEADAPRVRCLTHGSIDRFAGLSRIGIDEISYKRHHR